MINTSCKILFIIAASVMSLAAYGQGRRTVAYHDSRLNQTMRIEVYDYDFVDEQPHFPGGDKAMVKFINEHRRYPADAYLNRVEGRVLCSFVVNADGEISHVRVLRGVEPSLNAEAVRVINEMPRWRPGKVDDATVPVFCILPIPFRL